MPFTKIVGAGIQTTTDVTFRNIQSGIVTATSFIGDISQATGAAAGLGTALSQTLTSPLNKIYYTNQVLSIGSTITVDPPASSNVAYTQYSEIAVEEGYDLIVEDGDDLVTDILGLSTVTATPLSGAGGRVRADQFTNKAGSGAPTFTRGLQVTGVATATSFSGNLTGNINATGVSTFSGGIQVGVTTSITVGSSFIRNNAVGLGTTSTTGRDAGIGTVTGTLIYNATTDAIQVYSPFGWANVISLFTATGGTESTVSRTGYKVHTFTSTNPFVVSTGTKTAEYLLVAGGGGGGSGNPTSAGHGGGGGGGILSGTFTLNPGTYTVTVGGGGAFGTFPNPGYAGGSSGQPSNIVAPGVVGFTSVTAIGGGGGGAGTPAADPAKNGGSGGGGGYNQPGAFGLGPATPAPVIASFPTYTPGTTQGRDGGGGQGNTPPYAGGGGGGAGGTGGAGTSGLGGAGGPGNPFAISGTPATYGGGGGGGGGYTGSNTGGAGGPGGGGAGGSNPTPATGGTGGTNTGGGGGGGAGVSGGSGGSGIVIIAYQT